MLYMSSNRTTRASTEKFMSTNLNQILRSSFVREGMHNQKPLFYSKLRPKSANPSQIYNKSVSASKRIYSVIPEDMKAFQEGYSSALVSPKSSVIIASNPTTFRVTSTNFKGRSQDNSMIKKQIEERRVGKEC